MMNPRLRLALLALALLLVAAGIGIYSGSRRADPKESAPHTPLLDTSGFESVKLMPPDERPAWLNGDSYQRPPVGNPKLGEALNTQPAFASAPPGASPALAAPAVAGTRSYRVRENDTFSKIARREYGSADHAKWLMQANALSDPTKLRIGDVLVLPPLPAPGAVPVKVPPAASKPVATEARSYVVQKNDTLGQISQRLYGSSRHADLLMKANGLKRPEDLRAGQTLTVPALP